MNWFTARDLAKAGTPIRRLPWTDKWITYWRGLWWCHIRDSAARVVRTTDFGKTEFLAEDWTTIAPEREDCPPVEPPIVDPPPVDPPIVDPPPVDPPIVDPPPVDPPIVDPPPYWPPVEPPVLPPINPNPFPPVEPPVRPPRPPVRPHPTGFTLTATANCYGSEVIVECHASVSDAITGDRWMVSIRGAGTRSGGSGFVGPGEQVTGSFTLDAPTYDGRTLTYTANFSELDHPGGSASASVTITCSYDPCGPSGESTGCCIGEDGHDCGLDKDGNYCCCCPTYEAPVGPGCSCVYVG